MLMTLLILGGLYGPADTSVTARLYSEAVAARQDGELALAEEKIHTLVDMDRSNPGYFTFLGDVYMRDGKLKEAREAYVGAAALEGTSGTGEAKKVAACSNWLRQYSSAEQWLRRVLDATPGDQEAEASLSDLKARRSLHLFGGSGGSEVDYTTKTREGGVFLGWIEWLDLYGGYSVTDHIFYRRSNAWIDAYLFPSYSSFVRVGLRNRKYEYPVSINPNPDHSSYNTVAEIQLEGTHVYGTGNSASLELDLFRPTFYWNNSLAGAGTKIGFNLRNTIAGPVYARAFGALLRDPDPSKISVDPETGRDIAFEYESVGLMGGGLGYDRGNLTAEVKYLPDRDLDRSINWSVFGNVRYMFDWYGFQADFLYDTFRNSIDRGFSVSRVQMITALLDPSPFVEIRLGAKTLQRLTTSVAPFVYVRYKTGV